MNTQPTITCNNYHESTRAVFTVFAVRQQAASKWAEMTATFGLDHHSDSGSQYIVLDGIVYRYSNHWGQVSSCVWTLDKPIATWMLREKSYILAYCPLAEFEGRFKATCQVVDHRTDTVISERTIGTFTNRDEASFAAFRERQEEECVAIYGCIPDEEEEELSTREWAEKEVEWDELTEMK